MRRRRGFCGRRDRDRANARRCACAGRVCARPGRRRGRARGRRWRARAFCRLCAVLGRFAAARSPPRLRRRGLARRPDGALLWSDGIVCGTPNWSGAQYFLDAFSGRTRALLVIARALLVIGDSMVNALAMGIADMLQPHLRRNMTQVTSSCHLQMTDNSMLVHCAAYDRGFLLCSLRNVEAAYSSPGAAWRTEQALAGNLQPSDVVIANLGIHFKYSAIQDLKDLRRLTMAELDYFKTKDEPGPLLFWLETAAQHFPRGVFDPKGKRGAGGACVDLTSGSAGWRATLQRDLRGPYNALTNPHPLAARAGIAVVRLFDATLPLFERHAAKGDCSHFRTTDDGPYRFVAQRIAALAHHAAAAGALPHPPPFDDAALRGRWSRLMENSDSVLAKIAQCAVPNGAEKFRWRWRDSCPSTPPAVRKCVCEQERWETCVTAATNLKANLCYPNPKGPNASNGLMCAGAPAHRGASATTS
ncbi:hypothetical protein M885DRAFT_517453 [Pelagophyceae sp. CCMP2097]|nr:hypothetical protein M885DRAFT_517453 [Pelagophyceae sp. CCMP2097]